MTTNKGRAGSVGMTFDVAPGSRVNKKDLKALLAEFERLRQGGMLTAERVLDAAEDDSSVLHKFFEWDDSRAARLYRLDQARRLIRAVDVIVTDAKSGKSVRMRANYSVRDAQGHRGYQAFDIVFEDANLADQVIDQTIAQLESLKARLPKYQWAKRAIPHIAAALTAIRAATKKSKKK